MSPPEFYAKIIKNPRFLYIYGCMCGEYGGIRLKNNSY